MRRRKTQLQGRATPSSAWAASASRPYIRDTEESISLCRRKAEGDRADGEDVTTYEVDMPWECTFSGHGGIGTPQYKEKE